MRPHEAQGPPPRERAHRGERGSSVVMFVVALPLLLVFLFAVIDLGRTVFLRMALEDAAYAACRVASDDPALGASEERLVRAAYAASPGLEGDGLLLEATATYGELEEVAYAHRWYDAGADAFAELPAHADRRSVEVECVLRGDYLTPLGRAFSLAEGGEGASFAFRARARGVCDETVEGGSR